MTYTSELSIKQAENIVSSIVGEYVWFVRCTESHILQMEFGQPHLRIEELRASSAETATISRSMLSRRLVLPTGGWSLFVEDGLWQVHAGQLTCKRADPDLLKIGCCLDRLSGQKVRSVSLGTGTSTLKINFDLSGCLDIDSNIDFDGNSQWIIFSKEGWNLSLNGRGSIELEHPDKD